MDAIKLMLYLARTLWRPGIVRILSRPRLVSPWKVATVLAPQLLLLNQMVPQPHPILNSLRESPLSVQ